jgi:hypothetical protein
VIHTQNLGQRAGGSGTARKWIQGLRPRPRPSSEISKGGHRVGSPRPRTGTAAREPPAAPRPSRFAVAYGEPCPNQGTSGRDEPARPRRSRQPTGVGWHPKIARAVSVPVTMSAHGHERSRAVNSAEPASRRSGHLGSGIVGLPNWRCGLTSIGALGGQTGETAAPFDLAARVVGASTATRIDLVVGR